MSRWQGGRKFLSIWTTDIIQMTICFLILFLQIMKTSELIISITAVLLIALTIGDGSPAPKWRPQGRFGKRVSELNDDPLWVLLSCK